MEDQLIIELFMERSPQAINELSAKYGGLCYTLSRRFLSAEDAEECVNDAYLAVWNSIPPEQPRSLSAYLAGITRNLSLKRYRANTAQRRRPQYEQSLDELLECFPDHESAETMCDAKMLGESLNRFLAALPQKDRTLFVRRYWMGEDVSAIARALGVRRNTVSVRLHRIRASMKDYLKKEGYFENED